jgi:hypothetical protein
MRDPQAAPPLPIVAPMLGCLCGPDGRTILHGRVLRLFVLLWGKMLGCRSVAYVGDTLAHMSQMQEVAP